ncbi:MAG: hypothetical protein WD696_15885 [Bryobacteraceae bacterium]
MIRNFAIPTICLLFGVVGIDAQEQEQGQLDASPTLFTVLAAMNAAGYDAEIDSPNNHPLREMVRKEIAARNPAVLAELREFFKQHRQRDEIAEQSQYVSYALSVKGPPDFEIRFRDVEIPPDVLPVMNLSGLLSRFYEEAGIEELWRKAQPAFDKAIESYHTPATRAVLEVNSFLRNSASGYLGRRFQIYIDLLGAPNQIQSRSYGDDYFVVLTPSPEPQIEDVRHGYLHYLLDPLATKFAAQVEKKKSLIDYAQGAPALPKFYKEDFLLLATESLIKAVESRLSRSGRAAMVDQAVREGYILTAYFAEQLPEYEKQEQGMRLYFPELIEAIDLKKEVRRLDKVQFAAEPAMRKAKVVVAERKVELTGVFKTLEDAERLYGNRELDKAREAYLRVLQETDEKSLHAKSYYGLARIAVLQRDPSLAERLFQKILESQPDAEVKGWTLVYLGRLADAAGERDQAVKYYNDALSVTGASAGARKAAEKGAAETFKK